MALPIADTIRTVLADGAPHYELEILFALAKIIPPEYAIRARDTNLRHDAMERRQRDIYKQIELGIKNIARSALKNLEDKKEIVREPAAKGTKRQWRMVDEEYMAWHRVTREVAERMKPKAGANGHPGGAPADTPDALTPGVPSDTV